MSDHSQIRNLIASQMYMTLATVDEKGAPWSTPLHFVADDHYNFYWYSQRNAKHSLNVAQNEQAAVTIYDANFNDQNSVGLYMTGTAFEIPEADLSRVMDLYASRAYPGDTELRDGFVQMTADFKDKSPLRFYVFCPKHAWVTDRIEFRNNKWLDQRKEVTLS